MHIIVYMMTLKC